MTARRGRPLLPNCLPEPATSKRIDVSKKGLLAEKCLRWLGLQPCHR